ncbi:MAG: EamA family transporter RarD [Homoserinimonas sp.]
MALSVNPIRSDAESRQRSGVFFAVGAYGLWGIIPFYFLLLAPAGGVEIVAWRILFSLVFCAILLTVTRKWPAFMAIVRRPRLVLATGLAGVLIYANWQVYVLGVLDGRIVEAALGYFINPIVTVLLGVIVLRERLRPLQWVAIGVSAAAILVLVIGLGSIPWIALTLAMSFGLYGLVKKRAGVSVDAITGLTLETLWLVPVASIILIIVGSTSGIVLGTVSPGHTVLLLSAGVITAVPLLLFASAARRLSLVGLGLIQYLAPVLQFIFGVFIMHEAMPLERWIGFALVWVALIILTWDLIAHGRAARRALPLPA